MHPTTGGAAGTPASPATALSASALVLAASADCDAFVSCERGVVCATIAEPLDPA
jgi:hypothetical protein